MPYNEYIGRVIPLSLSRAMKTYNVSPSDLSDLESVYGEDDVAIEAAVNGGRADTICVLSISGQAALLTVRIRSPYSEGWPNVLKWPPFTYRPKAD